MPPKPPATTSADHPPFEGTTSIPADPPSPLNDRLPEDHSDFDQLLAGPELRQLLLETGTFLGGVERFLSRVARELECDHMPEAAYKPRDGR